MPFANRAQAEESLAHLEPLLEQQLVVPLASLLSHSPDPDGALCRMARYAAAASAEILQDLARHPTALTYLMSIFGYSEYLGETFLAEPALPIQFARDRHFTRLKSADDLMQDHARYSVTSPDLWLSSQLARFKTRNHLRIALKDVLGYSTFSETSIELSTLADVILSRALAYCAQELEKRYGRPQYRDAEGRIARSEFSLLSLGTLGGNELNYGSDIDLLFLYGRDGETSGGSEHASRITNKGYFVRLAEAVTRTITQETPQGQVYRVDLRQRPEGEKGDLAISLNSAREYYEHRARDWELQMLIKARHSAGDPRLTRDFLRNVEPYLYRAPLNGNLVEGRSIGDQINSPQSREERDAVLDVKLRPGGIRDIEFLAQNLQRTYGAHEPWVRTGGTLFALRKLNDKRIISDADFACLASAYEFLGKVDHRLQLEGVSQSHCLPADPVALNRLARRVGADGASSEGVGSRLVVQVDRTLKEAEKIYRRLIGCAKVASPV